MMMISSWSVWSDHQYSLAADHHWREQRQSVIKSTNTLRIHRDLILVCIITDGTHWYTYARIFLTLVCLWYQLLYSVLPISTIILVINGSFLSRKKNSTQNNFLQFKHFWLFKRHHSFRCANVKVFILMRLRLQEKNVINQNVRPNVITQKYMPTQFMPVQCAVCTRDHYMLFFFSNSSLKSKNHVCPSIFLEEVPLQLVWTRQKYVMNSINTLWSLTL